MGLKTIRLGNKTTTQKGKPKLILGNTSSKDSKYHFTVKVRIERPGELPVTLVNPQIFFAPKHEKAPDWIEEEVVVYQDDGND